MLSMPLPARRLTAAFPLLLSLALLVDSKPWHQVNKFDLAGATCPVPVRINTACPLVCAPSPSQCPPQLSPTTCLSTQTYCPDGQCHDGSACPQSSLDNSLCACPFNYLGGLSASDGRSLIPCRSSTTSNGGLTGMIVQSHVSDFRVNVSGYVPYPTDGDEPLFRACASALGVSNGYVDAVTNARPFLRMCLPKPERSITWAEPEFVVLYALAGFVAVVVSVHAVYKKGLDGRGGAGSATTKVVSEFGGGYGGRSGSPTMKKEKVWGMEDEVELRGLEGNAGLPAMEFVGYREDWFGSSVVWIVRGATVVWVALILVMVADYYQVFSGLTFRDEAMVFVNHNNLSRAFIVVWHVVTLWFVLLKLGADTTRTYFGRRVPLRNATLIQVRKRVDLPVPLAGMGVIAETVRRVEEKMRKLFRIDVAVFVVPVHNTTLRDERTGTHGRYIEFECVRYIYDEAANHFEIVRVPVGPTHADLHRAVCGDGGSAVGLSSAEAKRRLDLVGPNEVAFPADGWGSALAKEFSDYFYIYQMMMLFIWYYYGYYYMGLVLTVVIVASGVTKVYVYLAAQRRVLKMASFTGRTRTLRDGVWKDLSTRDLVPGDVIEIRAASSQRTDTGVPLSSSEDEANDEEDGGDELGVDVVLVDGGAVVDESSLTGEALPVAKFPVRKEEVPFAEAKGNAVYAGCRVLQTQPSSGEGEVVRGVVTRTGSGTSKGELVKDILYPSPMTFVFYEHLKVVFPLLIVWGVIMLILSTWMLGWADVDAWFYGMFTISQVLSPLLPAVLVIGQSVASERLRKQHGILCVDLARITLAGKVKIFAFDKTGTLTKEGLSFLGVRTVTRDHGVPRFDEGARAEPVDEPFSPRNSLSDQLPSSASLDDLTVQRHVNDYTDDVRRGMSTCHSVTMVGQQFVGNFVDVEMFRATHATLAVRTVEVGLSAPLASSQSRLVTVVTPRGTSDRPLTILKRHEFVHAHAYMSTLVYDGDIARYAATGVAEGKFQVFMKGSFEKIRALVDASSLPADYEAVAERYASEHGCYVIALAVRDVEPKMGDGGFWWEGMGREEVEGVKGARLIGLMLFRNELKEDTAEALEELRLGGCRVVMVTGDHVGTATHVARRCGMVPEKAGVGEPLILIGDVVDEGGTVMWKNVEDGSVIGYAAVHNLLEAMRGGRGRNIELAVTGKAFNALVDDGIMRKILLDTRIFARMTPEDKIHCVRLHMERAVTAMCGDGGNDAGALKASHAGVALSNYEVAAASGSGKKDKGQAASTSSSVVSHFSARDRSLRCCVELLKEGRCSLDVGIASYKYLIMYGEVLAFMGLIQYYFTINMSQALWIVVDGSTVPLSWAMTMALPAYKLASSRPTARLLGPETVISVTGQVLIDIAFQIIAVVILFGQSWFRCNEFDGTGYDVRRWWTLSDSFESEVTSILGVFQIIHSAAAFSMGGLYRRTASSNFKKYEPVRPRRHQRRHAPKPPPQTVSQRILGFLWSSNPIFVGIYLAIAALLSYVLLADPNPLGCLVRMNCGTRSALEGLGYSVSGWSPPDEYFSPIGHNVMPMSARLWVWGLCLGNGVVLVLFQGLVLNGGTRKWGARLWNGRRRTVESKCIRL